MNFIRGCQHVQRLSTFQINDKRRESKVILKKNKMLANFSAEIHLELGFAVSNQTFDQLLK